ncbi:MAG: hypothetical protein ACTSPB_26375 [Candidatus Thorarchaeota archaeon]
MSNTIKAKITKAYKKNYRFLSTQREAKYALFLKSRILQLNPKFYSVGGRKRILTPDGVMFVLHITKFIESPDLEPIAECWINGSYIYLWRDKCWGIAVNKNGEQIQEPRIKMPDRNKLIEKTSIVFQIGTDDVA